MAPESTVSSKPDSRLPARLIQLAPRFRPDADGLGECALNLGDALSKGYGVRTDFLAYNPPRPGAALQMPEPFPHTLQCLAAGGAKQLDRALDALTAGSSDPPVLLVHYVSYGYSRGGIAWWLPGVVERFRGRGGRFIGLFHELFAAGAFPSRTFFTSRLQRGIFRRLLAQSDAAFVSSEDFLKRIEPENRAHRPVSLIGICSNVGEPENPKPLASRRRRLAVFGQYLTRKNLYTRYLSALLRVAEHLGIDEIADIGPVEEPAWIEERVYRPLGGLVRGYGTLPVAETSRLLEDSILGAVPYRYSMRWKSGVFGAYQAHAMAILLFPYEEEVELREPGDWCLSADQLLEIPQGSSDELQRCATAGHRHYTQYRSSRSMAEALLPALRECR